MNLERSANDRACSILSSRTKDINRALISNWPSAEHKAPCMLFVTRTGLQFSDAHLHFAVDRNTQRQKRDRVAYGLA